MGGGETGCSALSDDLSDGMNIGGTVVNDLDVSADGSFTGINNGGTIPGELLFGGIIGGINSGGAIPGGAAAIGGIGGANVTGGIPGFGFTGSWM